ncbi:hypothetical protein RM543_17820 [Roseicyclus sp. F158]|uniref:Methyltransferase n=1 Tax=Tropicimonas omnivorans TaxID=3075590 RepID=A0ABU3DLD8_9RHOB|nr:hypothetical protein [Roseicyclus sp. F158]MDT0684533.1 hypothetical protein [Roseicyclus sp. F158]
MVVEHWNESNTQYEGASEHYDRAYFADQTRYGLWRGQVNTWKLQPYLKDGLDILDFGCDDVALLAALGGKN